MLRLLTHAFHTRRSSVLGGGETGTLSGQQLGADGQAFAFTSAVASTGTPSGSVTLGAAVGDAPYPTAPSGNPLALSPASTTPAGGSPQTDNMRTTLGVQFWIANNRMFPYIGWRLFRPCNGLIMANPFTAERQRVWILIA